MIIRLHRRRLLRLHTCVVDQGEVERVGCPGKLVSQFYRNLNSNFAKPKSAMYVASLASLALMVASYALGFLDAAG